MAVGTALAVGALAKNHHRALLMSERIEWCYFLRLPTSGLPRRKPSPLSGNVASSRSLCPLMAVGSLAGSKWAVVWQVGDVVFVGVAILLDNANMLIARKYDCQRLKE